MVFIQSVDGVSYYLDEYRCGWERNYTTYPVRDTDNQLVCMYRKQSYPYNIKGGVKV